MSFRHVFTSLGVSLMTAIMKVHPTAAAAAGHENAPRKVSFSDVVRSAVTKYDRLFLPLKTLAALARVAKAVNLTTSWNLPPIPLSKNRVDETDVMFHAFQLVF